MALLYRNQLLGVSKLEKASEVSADTQRYPGHPEFLWLPPMGLRHKMSVCSRPGRVFQTAQGDVCWKDMTWIVSACVVLTSQWIMSSREPFNEAPLPRISYVKDWMGCVISSEGGCELPFSPPSRRPSLELRDTFREERDKGERFLFY